MTRTEVNIDSCTLKIGARLHDCEKNHYNPLGKLLGKRNGPTFLAINNKKLNFIYPH